MQLPEGCTKLSKTPMTLRIKLCTPYLGEPWVPKHIPSFSNERSSLNTDTLWHSATLPEVFSHFYTQTNPSWSWNAAEKHFFFCSKNLWHPREIFVRVFFSLTEVLMPPILLLLPFVWRSLNGSGDIWAFPPQPWLASVPDEARFSRNTGRWKTCVRLVKLDACGDDDGGVLNAMEWRIWGSSQAALILWKELQWVLMKLPDKQWKSHMQAKISPQSWICSSGSDNH